MSEISKSEFKRLMLKGLIEWPPFYEPDERRVYGKKVECEDTPQGWVYYELPA
jgi:hypothetical protein